MDAAFDELLSSCIAGDTTIAKAERHLLDPAGAKRVRPRYLLACGGLLGVAPEKLLESAVAVELMHTATLVHDDIIDKADERRSRPSVHAAYGNTMALLAGDWLFLRSLLVLAQLKHGAKDAVKHGTETLMEITESMAREADPQAVDAVVKDVIAVADGKTGALFGLCGYLAALAAGDAESAKRFNEAGRLVGRAFQIRDDIDDLEEDMAQGVVTLPQLVSRAEAEKAIEDALRAAVEQLKPYAGRPGHTELVQNVYVLARTPMPAGLL